MGFFENLFKKEAKKFIGNVVDNAVDGFLNRNNDDVNCIGVEGLRMRLEAVLHNEYNGNYQVRENIPSTELGAEYGAVDYSYGIYNNYGPVVLINIIEERNDYQKKRFRLAKEAAENNNIPHLNFFAHLPNREEYISKRLRDTINR